MALIKCPECGKEVSDKASACPNCGYRMLHPEKTAAIIKYAKIGIICLIAVVAIIALYKAASKDHSPFEKFSPQMTKEEVHKKFGEPDLTGTEYNTDHYSNVSFVGLVGELSVWYRNNEKESIDRVSWYYMLKEGETFADYSKQVERITELFTEMYGLPSEEYGHTIWKDSVGQEYWLKLDSNSSAVSLPPMIWLTYQP